ncbi:MAG: helix-turn-helix domain-containing protein [Candidatus Obscuribacterales bacterium]|nr:helix-turn-helix domain-containing protein [Steroidobacteraceae bacterium]
MHPINSPTQIGKILVSRRKALGISQATLAAKLAMSQQRLSELETQSGSLTVERLTAWLTLLNLDLGIGERSSKAKAYSKVEW